MNELFLRSHLGLGDHLATNAIVRALAASNQVVVPCKPHNLTSVAFMFRDLANVDILALDKSDPDGEADRLASHAEKMGYGVLRLGFTGQQPFEVKSWDKCFYRQAGIPFSDCWSKFGVTRQPSRELPLPDVDEYIFVHEDRARNCLIDQRRLPKKVHRVFADPKLTDNIFDWWNIVEHAAELHLMESSFAILADHLPDVEAQRIVIHEYCRKSVAPTYQRKVVRLK